MITKDRLIKNPLLRWVVNAFLVLVFVRFLFDEAVPTAAPCFGVAAQASVDRLWTGKGRHGGTVYFVGVRFTDRGRPRFGSSYVDKSYYSTLSTGQTVPIHYLPFFPFRLSLDVSPHSAAYALASPVVFVFFLLFFNASVKKRDPPLE